jgi:AcrR family transcriptional regulator
VSARQRILDTAARLFYERGLNSTGIDLIIAEANVAKASLYNNFDSKERLIAEYLKMLRVRYEEMLARAVWSRGRTVEIPFDLLEEIVVDGEFFGCPFTNALTELPHSKLVKAEVLRYRNVVMDFFAGVAAAEVVPQLMIVYDGVFTSCKIDPDRRNVAIARKLAQILVDLVPREVEVVRKP